MAGTIEGMQMVALQIDAITEETARAEGEGQSLRYRPSFVPTVELIAFFKKGFAQIHDHGERVPVYVFTTENKKVVMVLRPVDGAWKRITWAVSDEDRRLVSTLGNSDTATRALAQRARQLSLAS